MSPGDKGEKSLTLKFISQNTALWFVVAIRLYFFYFIQSSVPWTVYHYLITVLSHVTLLVHHIIKINALFLVIKDIK